MSESDEWIKAAEKMGHKLILNPDGSVDFFAYDYNMHNGPKCDRCGQEWCHHCTRPESIRPCDGGTKHLEFTKKQLDYWTKQVEVWDKKVKGLLG